MNQVILGLLNLIFVLSLLSPAQARNRTLTWAGQLPDEWYKLPEDHEKGSGGETNPKPTPVNHESIGMLVDKIYETDTTAMESVIEGTDPVDLFQKDPEGYVPWHLEMFATDLAITFQGLIGVLTFSGTPQIQAFWRRPGTRPDVPEFNPTSKEATQTRGHPEAKTQSPRTSRNLPSDAPISMSLTEEVAPKDISKHIEPAVRAAVATGKVTDENALRTNLTTAAQQFQAIAQILEQRPKSRLKWWVSGFRIDFLATASGHVLPFLAQGGDIRIRFDFKRLKRDLPQPHPVARPPRSSIFIKEELLKFVSSMEQKLETASQESFEETGMAPYGIRIGIGITAGGNIGIAKGSASVIGDLNFSSDANRPLVYPNSPESNEPISVIQNNPSDSHLKYAKSQGIRHEVIPPSAEQSIGQAIYHLEKTQIQKGLNKAFKMGSFFAKRAKNIKNSKWKLYQMYVMFDTSLTGDIGLANLGGLGTFEVDFYNEDF